jgi:predicted RecB family nuclease
MDDWVSAGDIRNWFADDTLLDWLQLYGEQRGFKKDTDDPDFEPQLHMPTFIMAKGREFERRVVELLRKRCAIHAPVGEDREERARDTERLIANGAEAIYQGTLLDHAARTYGKPDLIVRNDVLARLCDNPPKAIDGESHYRIVDIKFTTAKLLVSGYLNSGFRANAAQLFVYNRALGAIQNYLPNTAYIIGRTYEGKSGRRESCLHLLAPAKINDVELAQDVDSAVHWIRKLREEGADWSVLPEPSNDWMRPNMRNDRDFPWYKAKKEINEQIKDHTTLWRVSPKHRRSAIANGVFRHDDANCCADIFGLSHGYAKTLQCILDVQREAAPPIMPARIDTDRENWHPKRKVEFFVDFETANDLNDNFEKLPDRGGQNLIFMIGCGHEEEGEWKFECFICDRMREADERVQIEKWIDHMKRTCLSLGGMNPHVFHWSPHEKVSLTTHFESARKRHPGNDWPEPTWYDFLNKVVKPEPVTVKGAYAFGLKPVANAMYMNGLTDTNWGSSRIDGLGAMLGGWACDVEAEKLGCSMRELDLMKEIEEYNEIDCKVMWEAINYLREHH